jgi:hypothetical protein
MGTVGDSTLARTRPSIVAVREAGFGPVVARAGQGAEIVQDIVSNPPKAPSALMIVVDGSVRVEAAAAGISAALDKIPAGTPVGLIIAAEPMRKFDHAPWSEARKLAAAEMIAATSFAGGQDNTRALADALLDVEKYDNAALLWVHGPQPITFRDTAGVLEQAASRLVRRPQVWLMPTEPGPNEALPDLPWAWAARSIPASANLDADLSAFVSRVFLAGSMPTIRRTEAPPYLASEKPERAAGSEHIARLWARDRVLTLMSENEMNRDAAVALATEYRLVTPVSGAVVLETQQQYDDSRLTPSTKAAVPTVPEPEEWALIILSALAFLWLMRRRQAGGVAA